MEWELAIFRVLALLCILILPLAGPSKKRRKISYKRPDKAVVSTNYGINENGELEEKKK